VYIVFGDNRRAKEGCAVYSYRFLCIKEWSVEDHNVAYESNLTWVNSEVSEIEKEESTREIIIFTHHCPTILPQAQDQDYKIMAVNWVPRGVRICQEKSVRRVWLKLWVFGHTHFNCDFQESTDWEEGVCESEGVRED